MCHIRFLVKNFELNLYVLVEYFSKQAYNVTEQILWYSQPIRPLGR